MSFLSAAPQQWLKLKLFQWCKSAIKQHRCTQRWKNKTSEFPPETIERYYYFRIGLQIAMLHRASDKIDSFQFAVEWIGMSLQWQRCRCVCTHTRMYGWLYVISSQLFCGDWALKSRCMHVNCNWKQESWQTFIHIRFFFSFIGFVVVFYAPVIGNRAT